MEMNFIKSPLETVTVQRLKPEIFQYMGEITFLMMHSKVHYQYTVSTLKEIFIDPICLGQVLVYHNADKQPIGVVAWAWLNDELDEQMKTRSFWLKEDDWKSGKHLWVVEFIAPYGHSQKIGVNLTDKVFPNEIFKSHRTSNNTPGKPFRYNTWYGKNVASKPNDQMKKLEGEFNENK